MKRQFVIERLTQAQYGMFGHVIDAGVWHGGKRCHRRRVNDVALTILRCHDRHKGAYAVNNTPDVDIELPPEISNTLLPQQTAGKDASIIASDMDTTKLSHGGIGEMLYILCLGYIGHHTDTPTTTRVQRSNGLIQRFLLDIGKHHIHALVEKQRAHCAPDAAGATGNDGRFTCKFFHSNIPL